MKLKTKRFALIILYFIFHFVFLKIVNTVSNAKDSFFLPPQLAILYIPMILVLGLLAQTFKGTKYKFFYGFFNVLSIIGVILVAIHVIVFFISA